MRKHNILLLIIPLVLLVFAGEVRSEQRNQYSRIRIPAYSEFRKLYNPLYRIGALANFWNLHTYDVQMENPDPAYIDGEYYEAMKAKAPGERVRLDPSLESAAPRFARLAWGVGDSFMWTHDLHENAFDAYAAPGFTMEQRHRMVEDATDEYLRNPRALSPVEVPMEVIERLPYHGAFARKYPKMIGLIWAGHWFHGGVYEGEFAVLRGEKTREQVISSVDTEFERLVQNPPDRHPHFTMIAPEFTKMHPRTAAIFSNMHMLHDMVADILADDNIKDKRQAIYEARNMMQAGRVSAPAEGGTHHAH